MDFERVLFATNVIAIGAILIRFSFHGLYRTYKSLFLYLIVSVVVGIAGISVSLRSAAYQYIYFSGQTARLMVALFVVVELYRLALAAYPAVAAFGRWGAVYSVVVAGVIAFAGVPLDARARPGHDPVVQRFLTFERTLDLGVLVFLLLLCALILWFPVRIRRNIVLWIAGFTVFDLSGAVALLLENLLPMRYFLLTGKISMTIALTAFLAWLFGLSPEEQDPLTVVGHRWNPDAWEHLTHQLDAINSVLSRFVRSANRKTSF